MSEFEDFLPDYDQDKQAGIPDEFAQRTMLGEAVIMANNIHRELVGQVHGMLADYIKYALLESSLAAAALLTMHPKDERELFELQKRAAPYASVMAWVRENLRTGADHQQQLNALDERNSQEERDE